VLLLPLQLLPLLLLSPSAPLRVALCCTEPVVLLLRLLLWLLSALELWLERWPADKSMFET
jgi:hypothetical protein